MALFAGTDIGGTFTDIVGFDTTSGALSFGKKLTNRKDLVEGVVSCLHEVALPPEAIDVLKHGTTQVINTLLERHGDVTALVTTAGFRDLLEIGRAGRPVAFDLAYKRETPLIPRDLCFEVRERVDAQGNVLEKIDTADLSAIVGELKRMEVKGVAVSFLNSYVNPIHEVEVADFLRRQLPGIYVTAGHELSREWFEYERTSTAAANAYVGPRAAGYVDRFVERLAHEKFGGLFYMMGSNGGVLTPERVRQQPIALIESGPIGGCVGATVYSKRLGLDKLIAFDMGGTTAKCALVENAFFDVQALYYVGGYDKGLPLRTPVLDIVEVGTGGGSIAHLNGTRLCVGPRSASSEPGPVCFGKGGTEPTVTDANLVLGRISGSRFLNGSLPLDVEASKNAIMGKIGLPLGYAADGTVDEIASGIVTLANAQMATAIKEITIERGRDAREFTLFVFGGGGPLHGVELARELGIPKVVVPAEPGNFSALGMLFANARVDDAQSLRLDVDSLEAARFAAQLADIKGRVDRTLRQDFKAESPILECQAEMRFKGQIHALRIPFGEGADGRVLKERFLQAYEGRYGHVDVAAPIEITGVRVAGFASTETPDVAHIVKMSTGARPQPREIREVHFAALGARAKTPVYSRDLLPLDFEATGPLIVEEFGSTTVIGPGDHLRVGEYGQMEITLAVTDHGERR